MTTDEKEDREEKHERTERRYRLAAVLMAGAAASPWQPDEVIERALKMADAFIAKADREGVSRWMP